MDTIKTPSRIHPLMAAAAVSVIVVSLAGAAAITGLLPSSHGAPDTTPAATLTTAQAGPYAGAMAPAALPGVPAAYAAQAPQPLQAAYVEPASPSYAQAAAAPVQPAPVVIKETVIREVPAKPVHQVHHHTSTAQASYEPAPHYAPAPAPAQPNYVAIGTGAVVGGLIGNQVGHGRGRTLATVAGMIGGGFLGNQVANQNR